MRASKQKIQLQIKMSEFRITNEEPEIMKNYTY
jgi:hypothetical protein